ncbi:GGDEF domain-containing protein [Massilia violaceinigra]|uniref:diguanylate cyclase n=1 Tax=Massilia violaceinigra TaxID=2045208 RepID=A0ABY4A493_9BURK|nr:GGDEF domain-containing protein [Massilia violaceinigra]UOD29488.1 GGDEF domain-containing protein [Massilia violaceinigra]
MSTQCDGCPECAPLRARLAEKEQEILDLTESLTRHDTLTGALNRRALTELVAEELQRSSRTGQPFCVAMIGIDHLKDVNLQFGHDTGDAVLQAVSRSATELLRTLDRFGRIESDVFGIILPATWLHQGVLAMNRLNAKVAGFDWESVTPGRTVTFSTGLTTNAPAETADMMIQRAEKAMAEAKQEGRNRIVQIEQELPAGLFAAMDDM